MTFEDIAIEEAEKMLRFGATDKEKVLARVAIEAIEMRMPKKPAETDAYPHRVYCSTDECGFTFAFNKELVEVMGDLLQWSYCPKCGQAIDWSDYK